MKGSILFNGNIKLETDFIHKFRERITSSHHLDSQVRDSKKVLLITAAWQKREFFEGHIKKQLYEIGIPPVFGDNDVDNVQNLAIYHDFNHFKAEMPDIYQFYHSKQQVIQRVKLFYREKNSGLIGILRNQLTNLKKTFRNMSLARALAYDFEENAKRYIELNQWELLYHYACQDIQGTMKKIRENDAQMIQVCKEIDDYFFENAELAKNEFYLTMKKNLEQRILSANSIFIFGGNVAVLYNRLNFFKLRDTFLEALNRGTNFYTVSAGSLCLCDSLIIFDEKSNQWEEQSGMYYDFELFDLGFGLVKKVQIFPHCKEYIHMKDPDTVTYIAARFNKHLCVGMDQESFLLLETYEEAGKEYERFTSAGKEDGLYLFTDQGKIELTEYGEELCLPGTKIYENRE